MLSTLSCFQLSHLLVLPFIYLTPIANYLSTSIATKLSTYLIYQYIRIPLCCYLPSTAVYPTSIAFYLQLCIQLLLLSPFLMSLYPPSIHTHITYYCYLLSVATIYPSSIAIYYPSIVTYLLLIHSHFPFISNFLLLLLTLSIHFNCNLAFYYYLSPFYW